MRPCTNTYFRSFLIASINLGTWMGFQIVECFILYFSLLILGFKFLFDFLLLLLFYFFNFVFSIFSIDYRNFYFPYISKTIKAASNRTESESHNIRKKRKKEFFSYEISWQDNIYFSYSCLNLPQQSKLIS